MSAAALQVTASVAEYEMAQLIITALGLDGVEAGSIDPEAPLFGHGDGLGLDSIDALEIALAVQQQYGVELQAGDRDSKQTFSSLRALCAYVHGRRPP
jgi:acyl carrier protein